MNTIDDNAAGRFEGELPECPWGDSLAGCAITVCDADATVVYQNVRSREVNGDVVGRSLMPCHNDRSRRIISRLLRKGGANVYTIEKRGQRKLIYQAPWRCDGAICGLVEFSLEIPSQMPHYIRE